MMRPIRIAYSKLIAMTGGRIQIIISVLLLLACAWTVSYAVNSKQETALKVACVDNDMSQMSGELISSIDESKSITVILCDDEKTGARLISLGKAEGLLVIGEGYQSALEDDTLQPLTYKTADMASSAQMLRETAAGIAVAQRCKLRALNRAEEITGGMDTEHAAQFEKILNEDESSDLLYTVTILKGNEIEKRTAVFGSVYSRYAGFMALALMMCVLSVSSWFADENTKCVEDRMESVKHGRLLSRASDILALMLMGAVFTAVMLIPAGKITIKEMLMYFGFIFFITGLCILISRRFNLSGRVDVLAPYLALLTGAAGGCFADFGQLSGGFRAIALLTPQGLMLEGMSKNGLWPFLTLIGCGALMMAAAYGTGRFRGNR